jgi:hypothetical protein
MEPNQEAMSVVDLAQPEEALLDEGEARQRSMDQRAGVRAGAGSERTAERTGYAEAPLLTVVDYFGILVRGGRLALDGFFITVVRIPQF